MIRRWDDLAATEVRETDGARYPGVSPDGLELAFWQGGAVKVLSLAGGPVRTVVPKGQTVTWGPDGFIYASTDSGIVRVPAKGGAWRRSRDWPKGSVRSGSMTRSREGRGPF